jgi:hypothetical protein
VRQARREEPRGSEEGETSQEAPMIGSVHPADAGPRFTVTPSGEINVLIPAASVHPGLAGFYEVTMTREGSLRIARLVIAAGAALALDGQEPTT